MRDPKNMKEVITAVINKNGYIDSHDGRFHPASDFGGVCTLSNGYIGFLMDVPTQCINAVYIKEDGTAVLSQMSISGTLVRADISKRECWEDFNGTLLFGKVNEVLLKNGRYFNLSAA